MQFQGNEGLTGEGDVFFIMREKNDPAIIFPMIQLLEKAVRLKSFLIFMLLMPFCWSIIEMLIAAFRANPLQELLISTGESAVWLLVLLLWISPLRMIFPRFTILRSLQSQKRILGLGIFFYVLLHFLIYLVDRANLQEIAEDLFRVFLLSGLVAFLILLAMALTSSNRKIRQLGAKRWKMLHRGVYLAAGLILLHMLLKEKSDPLQAWLLFLPLTFAELLRFGQWLRKRRPT